MKRVIVRPAAAADIDDAYQWYEAQLRNALPTGWCGRGAIVAKTPQQFETEFPAYYLDVAAHGQILYDTDRYLEDRLDPSEPSRSLVVRSISPDETADAHAQREILPPRD